MTPIYDNLETGSFRGKVVLRNDSAETITIPPKGIIHQHQQATMIPKLETPRVKVDSIEGTD